MWNATLFGQLQELTLPLLFVPVVCSVFSQKAFRASAWFYLRFFALLHTTGTKIKAPYRQSYAKRFPLGIVLGRKEPVGYFLLFGLILPLTDKLHRPSIRCSEMANSLPGLICLYRKVGTSAHHTWNCQN